MIVQGVEVGEGAILYYKWNQINCELQIEANLAIRISHEGYPHTDTTYLKQLIHWLHHGLYMSNKINMYNNISFHGWIL